jgi:hypothetical protein
MKSLVECLYEALRPTKGGTIMFDIKNGKVKIDDDRQNDYLNKDDLIKCVKYYGLDVSAFWYLCLFIGDYVNGFSTEHTKSLSTSSLIEIFKLKEGFSKIGITHDVA